MGIRRAVGRWLEARRPSRPAAVVLVYHRIAELPADPAGLCVSPTHFAEHLEVVTRYAHPLHARELVQRVKAGADCRGTVALTFDDGYADLLDRARPLLDGAGTPATMFLATGAIDAAEEFWWDSVERALLHDRALPPRLRLRLAARTHEWSLGETVPRAPALDRRWRAWHPPATQRQAVYLAVYHALLALPPADRTRTVAELLAWAEIDPAARPSHRALREEEVCALAAGDLIEIGAHTVTHPVLATLSPAEVAAEIAGSRDRLRALLGNEIHTFAYPFGKPEHIGAHAPAAVRAAGFSAAFLNVAGTTTRSTDPYAVPRLSVGDVDGDAFGRLLWRTAAIAVG